MKFVNNISQSQQLIPRLIDEYDDDDDDDNELDLETCEESTSKHKNI